MLTDKFNNDSDVDFIVDFEPIELAQYADNYYDLKFSLENILQKPVDLLEEKAIKNPYFRQVVDKQRQLIYGHWNQNLALRYFKRNKGNREFFADRPKDFILYQNDIRTKRAIERNIEIIGEAMNRILNKDMSIEFSNARKIVDTRNRIIHGYDTVSDDIIWSIVIKHIPILQTEIQKLLNE